MMKIPLQISSAQIMNDNRCIDNLQRKNNCAIVLFTGRIIEEGILMDAYELINEKIIGISESDDMYYISIANGEDSHLVSFNKQSKELKYLGPIIANEFLYDLYEKGLLRRLSFYEIEEFKQSFFSFSSC